MFETLSAYKLERSLWFRTIFYEQMTDDKENRGFVSYKTSADVRIASWSPRSLLIRPVSLKYLYELNYTEWDHKKDENTAIYRC